MAVETDQVTIIGDGTLEAPIALNSPLVLAGSRIAITSNEPGQAAISAESTVNYGIFAKASSGGASAIWAHAAPGASDALLASHEGGGSGVSAQSKLGVAGTFNSEAQNQPGIIAEGDIGGRLIGNTLGLRVASMQTGTLILGLNRSSGNEVFKVGGDGTVYSKGVQLISDRNVKANFVDVDKLEILEKVARLPISSWNYEDECSTNRHLSPVAQDFHHAFGLNGDNDTHISVIDLQGVALAAIQGLYHLNQQQDARITKLEKRITELSNLLDK
jgi:Chaperone of endosialidase